MNANHVLILIKTKTIFSAHQTSISQHKTQSRSSPKPQIQVSTTLQYEYCLLWISWYIVQSIIITSLYRQSFVWTENEPVECNGNQTAAVFFLSVILGVWIEFRIKEYKNRALCVCVWGYCVYLAFVLSPSPGHVLIFISCSGTVLSWNV